MRVNLTINIQLDPVLHAQHSDPGIKMGREGEKNRKCAISKGESKLFFFPLFIGIREDWTACNTGVYLYNW